MQTRTSRIADPSFGRHPARVTTATQLRQANAAQVLDTRETQSIQRQVQSIASQSSAVSQLKLLQTKMAAKAEVTQRVEDELVQGQFGAVQRVEEDETLQGKFASVQRAEDEEALQGKFDTAQRVEEDEPSTVQAKLATTQRVEDEALLQGKFGTAQLAEKAKPNNTGLPNQLKAGIESLSGMSMDHVKVHYNSSQPAQLNAHAYAQGSDIHVAPGQEQHLPHEAWHVVQQAQGRVRPTMQMKEGVPVNDDAGLEHEADVMGAKAHAHGAVQLRALLASPLRSHTNIVPVMQHKTDIHHKTQTFNYVPVDKLGEDSPGKVSETVASTMEAWLDPNDPVVGTAPGDDQTAMMTSLRSRYNLKSHQLVKGHLLNHDLGGYGVAANLFPITKQANGEHLAFAEYPIKNALTKAKNAPKLDGVYYWVNAVGPLDDEKFEETAQFECQANLVEDINGERKLKDKILSLTIDSHIDSPSGKFDKYYDDETGDLLETHKNPGALKTWAHKGKGANPSDFGHETFREEQGLDGSKKTRIRLD